MKYAAILLGGLGGLGGLGVIGAAHAHHSFAVHFLPDQRVEVTGVVTEFRFRNPHGLVYFAVAGDAGEEIWRAETNSPNVLRRRGWSEDSIAVGERVTIEGYPARDDSTTMRIARVIFEDGRELVGQRPPAGDGADD